MDTALLLLNVTHRYFHRQGSQYHRVYGSVLLWIQQTVEVARQGNLHVGHVSSLFIPGVDEPDAPIAPQPPAFVEVAESDLVVYKRRHSAFFATDLDLRLRERGVRRVILAGAQSHICVRATAQDACSHGYDVLVVREAIGSDQAHLHAASVEDIERYMGRVISMYEYVSLIAGRRYPSTH